MNVRMSERKAERSNKEISNSKYYWNAMTDIKISFFKVRLKNIKSIEDMLYY